MIRLLENLPEGYPADALLSRVRGRHERVLQDITAAGADQGWKLMRREYRWCWRQLDGPRRAYLAPVFLFHELKALATAMRFAASGQEEQARESLADSLLAPELAASLCRPEPVGRKTARLGRELAGRFPAFAGLAALPADAPAALSERQFRVACWQTFASARHPAVRWYLGALRERQDLLACLKCARWALPEDETPGLGLAESAQWRVAAPTRSITARLRRLAGNEELTDDSAPTAAELDRIEAALGMSLLKSLSRRKREEPGLTVLLHYLLLLFLTAAGLTVPYSERPKYLEACS